MSGIIDQPVTSLLAQMETNEGVLTVDDLRAAIEAIGNDKAQADCTHLVSPSGMKRLSEGRQACCHRCGTILGPYPTRRPVE